MLLFDQNSGIEHEEHHKHSTYGLAARCRAGACGQRIANMQPNITPDELPLIILKSMKIIYDAVSSDVRHAGKVFTVAELPTDFGGSFLEEETSEPETAEDQEDNEHPGEFLYNFQSTFNKYPDEPFSIEVKPVGLSPEVEGLPGVKIEVIWQCDDTVNSVYVISEKNGRKSKPLHIMEFGDDDVSSYAGATTAGHSNLFSIEKIVQAADPNGPNKVDKASPGTRSEIKQWENRVLRSFMAVTLHKLG